MTEVNRALVVGAGICGLGAGLALARIGVPATVLEIKADPNVLGVGINQPGNSLRAMRTLGIFDEVCENGFEVNRIDFKDADGNLIVTSPHNLAAGGTPHAVGINRSELHRILLGHCDQEGVEIRYGTTAERFAEVDGRAHVVLSDGTDEIYDLLVGADGVNSTVRELIFGDRFRPQFTGAGAWRLTVPRPGWVDSIALFQAIGSKAGYIPLCHEPDVHPARPPGAVAVALRSRSAPRDAA